MDIVISGEGHRQGTEGHGEPSAQDRVAHGILQLTGWMMILGTVRLVCVFADYVSTYLEVSRFRLPTLRLLGRFFQDNPPAIVIGFTWPIILALLLRRTGSRPLLRASSLTFFILSLVGILNLLAGMFFSTDTTLLVGSFSVSRWALLNFNPLAAARSLMGVTQLTLELLTALIAWGLLHSPEFRGMEGAPVSGSDRTRLYGRLAIYLTLGFLVLNVRHSVWSAYLEVVNKSPLIRAYILSNDRGRFAPYHGPGVQAGGRKQNFNAENSLETAFQLAARNQVPEAKATYLKFIEEVDKASAESSGAGNGSFVLAQALNNLAWLLVTCDDRQFWSPSEALTHARRAVELAPDVGTYWNTLGVAYYRAEQWGDAERALRRSMSLREQGQGDSFDWFFLAMIEARKDRKIEGRQWYDRAVEWFKKVRDSDPELHRFQVEAAEALGLPRPPDLERSRRSELREFGISKGPLQRRMRGVTIIKDPDDL